MFKGKHCTERCKNSLNILRRQDKAAKLRLCQCDANEQIESFLCSDIKENMENLCFPEETTTLEPILDIIEDDNLQQNEIEDQMPKSSGSILFQYGNVFRLTVIFFYYIFF